MYLFTKLLKIFLLTLFLLLVQTSLTQQVIFKIPSEANRITGGHKDLRLQRYIVSIRINDTIFGTGHFCGGSILSKRTVITAAHCIFNKYSRKLHRIDALTIVAGSPNRFVKTEHTQILKAKKYILTTRITLDKIFKGHDITLIRLHGSFFENDMYVRRVPMITTPPREGTRCVTYGWGTLFYMGPTTAELVYANITIHSEEECARKKNFTIPIICASDKNDYEKDSCQGDSGSPLLCNGELMGIVSCGQKCANPDYPGFYTSLWYFRDWIRLNTGDKCKINYILMIIFLLIVIL